MTAPDAGDVLSAAGAALARGATIDGQFVRRHIGGLRAELLGRANAQRERVSTELTGALRHVGLVEWNRHVDILASGKPYRFTRSELPSTHALRRRGKGADLLVLYGDELHTA